MKPRLCLLPKLWVLALVLPLVALSGCAQMMVQMAGQMMAQGIKTATNEAMGKRTDKAPTFDEYTSRIEPARVGNGRIYFYQPGPADVPTAHAVVRLNNEPVGFAMSQRFFHLDRPAETYEAAMFGIWRPLVLRITTGHYNFEPNQPLGRVSFDLGAQQEQYIRLEWDDATKSLDPVLVSSAVGKKEIRKTVYSHAQTGVLVHGTAGCFLLVTTGGYVLSQGAISATTGDKVFGSFEGFGNAGRFVPYGPLEIIDDQGRVAGRIGGLIGSGLSQASARAQWGNQDRRPCFADLPDFSDADFPILPPGNQ